MTTINWLEDIPSKAIQPYTQEEKAYVVVEENDIGTPKTRARSTMTNTVHNFALRMSHAEFGTLKQWVRLNLRNGTLPFNFPDPRLKPTTPPTYLPMRFMIETDKWFSMEKWDYDYVQIRLTMEQLDG